MSVCLCVRLAFHISISVVKQIFEFCSNSLSFNSVIRLTTTASAAVAAMEKKIPMQRYDENVNDCF